MSANNAASNKILITSVDGPKITVATQYNPKEIGIDKAVPWQKKPNSKGNTPELEFTSADGRSLSVELFFDTFEAGTNVHDKHVANLMKLAMVIKEGGTDESQMRPPLLSITWGGLPKFIGVLESVSTKYTMFTPAGVPVRATCSCKFKEASGVSFKKGATCSPAAVRALAQVR